MAKATKTMTAPPADPSPTGNETEGSGNAASPSDIPARSWIDRFAPVWARPYLRLARLDRPIGIWLLLFPCWWGVALAVGGMPDLRLLGLFALGAVIMRAAGCTYNDIVDRDLDARVARTAARPLARGALGTGQAVLFLALLLAAGFAVLLQFNGVTVALGLMALPLVFAYPLMKRLTYWPQAFLGLTFNWGALMGWAAVRGGIEAPALLLYGGGILWTLGYDTIYAHQDKGDDLMAGIKSTALRLGTATRPWLFVFFGLATAFLAAAGWVAGMGWPFFALMAVAAAHFGWQAATVALDMPRDCLAKFRSNQWIGWIVLAAILAGRAPL